MTMQRAWGAIAVFSIGTGIYLLLSMRWPVLWTVVRDRPEEALERIFYFGFGVFFSKWWATK